MEDKFFYVLELQTDVTGSCIPWSFTDIHAAESKFYAILSAAAISTVRRHGAVLMTAEGFVLKQEVFTHTVEA